MKKRLNILFISLLIGLSLPCDCDLPPTPENGFEMADVVFSGQVIQIVEDWNNFLNEVSISVSSIWKGEIANEVLILTGIDDGLCGYSFEIGFEYLIYGYYSGNEIWTDICTRTNFLEYANEDLDYLNQLVICDNGYTEINGDCYYQSDIDVLNIFIDNSPNINPILDTNNDGIIESLELCTQSWQDGRLQLLDCGPIIINGNYNWLEISGQVPSSIGNWDEIDVLNMSYNNLNGLVPENICDLNLNFNDSQIFSVYGNDLCPPFPECIEDYVGAQSNWGSGSCEISNCYDIGVTQITALELSGDNVVDDDIAHLLVTMHNDGPVCSTYPGLMITADVPGTSFPTEENESSVNWWYAMFADDTYFSDFDFTISPFVPPDTEITLTARSVIMGCLNEGCSEDPYCHDCPLTDPMSITITVGDFFPSQLGDSNFDGTMNILDIVLVVSLILNNTTYPPDNEENAIEIYLSNINQDNNIDVLDVVMLVGIILNF